jgi:hypothetical protein
MTNWDHEQRARFLAEARIGVLTVADTAPEAPTLSMPIWFDYDPAVGLTVITSPRSRKSRAIRARGRFGLVALDETSYRYVTVEGPLVEDRPCEPADLRAMAVRHLGEERGELYARQWAGAGSDDHVLVMRPETWFGADVTGDIAAIDDALAR